MSASQTSTSFSTDAYPLPWLTLERACLGLLLISAFMLRFVGLADAPLSPLESERALAGWHLVKGLTPGWWDAPALATAVWPMFFLLGDSDIVARLFPAIAGVALVGSPWLFRDRIGAVPCLVTSALLMISPSLWASARTVHEATPAVLTTVVMIWWLTRQRMAGDLTAAALGFGIACLLNLGAAGVTGLLAIGLFVAVRYALSPQGQGSGGSLRNSVSGALLWFAVGQVALGTAVLQHARGSGLPSVLAWVTASTPAAGLNGGPPTLLTFATLEPLAMLVGVPIAAAALVRWARHSGDDSHSLEGSLAVWGLLALVAAITGGQATVHALGVAAYPFLLLAGLRLGRTVEGLSVPQARPLLIPGAVVVFLLTFAYLGFAQAANLGANAPFPLVASLCLASAALVLVMAAFTMDTSRAVLAGGTLVLGGLFSVQATGNLAAMRLPPNETLVENTAIDALNERVWLNRFTQAGSIRTVAVAEDMIDELGWTLRSVPNVTATGVPEPGADIIIGPEGVEQAGATDYAPYVLPLSRRWEQREASPLALWRWAVWGRSNNDEVRYERAVMLVKGAS